MEKLYLQKTKIIKQNIFYCIHLNEQCPCEGVPLGSYTNKRSNNPAITQNTFGTYLPELPYDPVYETHKKVRLFNL